LKRHFFRVPALVLFLCVGGLWAGEIVVASYNVKNYQGPSHTVGGKPAPEAAKPEEEIAAVLEVLREIAPDILGLVEMGDESALEDLQLRLRAAGLDYPHREWVRGADEERHLALLSRHPIIARNSKDDVSFEMNGVRMRVGRGILDVTVRLGEGYSLRLVGAHLKSRREIPEFDQATMRAKESRCLREHLNDILRTDPSERLLLFGDLNDTKNEYPIKELMGHPKDPFRLRELPLADCRGERWTHYWAAADTYARIDYLLVSRGLWPDINIQRSGISDSKSWNKASDHRAIFTTLTIPKS